MGAFLPIIRFKVEGTRDVHNRYPSVVRVAPQRDGLSEGLRNCSGVIVAPRLVLTAGHCVCRHNQFFTPEGNAEKRVNGDSCADSAAVDVFFYEKDPRDSRRIPGLTSVQYVGKIRPHPRMEVRLNARGDILSSHADLAVISLNTPVPPGFRAIPLDTTPVVAQESLVLVGFGHAEDLGILDEWRLINERKVAAGMDEAGERFRLERRDESFFRGDSGGPCFREGSQGSLLVGISSTGLGNEPTLTSLRSQREWLQQEIHRVEMPSAEHTGSDPRMSTP